MPSDSVVYTVEGFTARVMLNKPDVHNAFDEEMIARLTEVFDELGKKKDIRVVVLRGKGRSFSAGADLQWMKRMSEMDEAGNYQDARKLAKMLDTLYRLPQLTIAGVHGSAMGGGFGLAACCDIVIADQSTQFALSEVRLGLVPATIALYVIGAIGTRQARRYFQTGERMTTATALNIGLVHESVGKAEDIENRIEQLLTEIGQNGPAAMRAAKRLCLDLDGKVPDEKTLDFVAHRIAEIRASDEARVGIKAFLEKKKAPWVAGNSA